MAKTTFLQLAKMVLLETQAAMSSEEIWKYAEEKGYTLDLNSLGKTPSATLGAKLYVSIKGGSESDFMSIGERPKRFFLKSMADKPGLLEKPAKLSEKMNFEKSYKENREHFQALLPAACTLRQA